MKCPICGQELRPGKKDPNYLLCYNCKKKFKIPQKKAQHAEEKEEQEEKKYSNIPPKHVRDKRESEMRKAYDDMLAVENGKGKKKTKRREEIEDDYDDIYDEEEEKGSKAPIIILAIAIVVVAGLIVFMIMR